MSVWQWVGVVALVLVGLMVVTFVAALVLVVRERWAGSSVVEPWVGRGRLDDVHPVRAVVIAWAQVPLEEEGDAWQEAHDAVRAAMPQLAAQLDRMVDDARRNVTVGLPALVGPCAYGQHDWRPAGVGGVRCSRCAVVGVA